MTHAHHPLEANKNKKEKIGVETSTGLPPGRVKNKQNFKYIFLCLGCAQPLGMTNGRIPDFALTASSKWDPQRGPRYGRLYTLHTYDHEGSWSSRRNVIGEWLQVDLGTVVMVTKIATQGRNSKTWVSQWVKQYTIEFSENGTKFHRYGNNKVTATITILFAWSVLLTRRTW